MLEHSVLIFTDGACSGNPGPGGWAAILHFKDADLELSGACSETTNNRMELIAALNALNELDLIYHVSIYSDSRYLCDGMSKWVYKWKKNKWRTNDNKPLKNLDLWQGLIKVSAKHDVKWIWIRGHAGHPENERADSLARTALNRIKQLA